LSTDVVVDGYRRAVTLDYPLPALGDGAVSLRRWALTDLDCVREASGDPEIPQGTTVPALFTPAAGKAFIERQWGRVDNREGLSLAITDTATDQALGLAVLLHRSQPAVVGMGYWVVPRARGRGLATRAVTLLARWALRETEIARVEAWVEPENKTSQKALLAAGFTREGVLRSFLCFEVRRADAAVFSLIRSDMAETDASVGVPPHIGK
jgi:RimJ/RimL family protein N-acetyltransferase